MTQNRTNTTHSGVTSRISGRAALAGLLALLVLSSACSWRNPNVKKQKYLASGQKYFDAGKYQEAAIQFQNAVQVDPRFVEGHYRLAQTYAKLQLWQNSFGELNRVISLDPNRMDAQVQIGEMLVAGNQPKMAQEKADLALARNGNDAAAHALQADILVIEKKLPEAMAELKRTIELDPKNVDYRIKLAVLQSTTGDHAGAEAALQQAVELAPKSIQPVEALAAYYLSQKRFPEAEAQYVKATTIDPASVGARDQLVRFYISQDQRDKAEAVARKAKQDLAKDPGGYVILAQYYGATGNADKALAEYKSLLQEHPKDNSLRRAAIELLLARKQYDEAEKYVQEILKVNKKDSQALLSHSRILMAQGKAAEALPTLEKLSKDEPQNAVANFETGMAAERTGDSNKAEPYFRAAVKARPDLLEAQEAIAEIALRKHDYDGLNDAAAALIKYHPQLATGYYYRAGVNFGHKKNDAAVTDLKTAITLNPKWTAPLLKLGEFSESERKLADAANDYHQALEINPASNEALSGVVRLALNEKQPAKAIAAIKTQIEKAPAAPNLYVMLGGVLLGQKDATGAEEALRKAISLDANNGSAYLGLTDVQMFNGQSDAVFETCAAWEKALPKDTRPLLIASDLYNRRNDWKNAQESYKKVLAINSQDPIAANNLAFSYLMHGGDVDQAIVLAEGAHHIAPMAPSIADTLGYAYYVKGRYDAALSLFKDAADKSPNNADFHYHLGLVYQKQLDFSKAKSEMQRALQLNPKLPQADEIKKQLGI